MEAPIEFITQGSDLLYHFRQSLIEPSIQHALTRLSVERQLRTIPVTTLKQTRLAKYEKLKSFVHVGSQCPSQRPLSWCSFSKSLLEPTTFVATAGWDGSCAIWKVPSLDLHLKLEGHKERATCIQFYPKRDFHVAGSTFSLASTDILGFVYFWSLQHSSPLVTFRAHSLRISSLAFHPLGNFFSTTSYDTTWRLFDIATQREILLQEGHSKEVFCQAYHPDAGSLLATGGLDGNAALWDIRTANKPIQLLDEHHQGILSLDWSPNGTTLATGSEDNTIRIWDLRKKNSMQTIFAHTSSVSSVKFQPALGHSPLAFTNVEDFEQVGGAWLLSASHDSTAKIWGAYDWKCLVTLSAHDNKIAHAEISLDSKFICTAGFDRSLKLWAC